jgi:hypothetical protein
MLLSFVFRSSAVALVVTGLAATVACSSDDKTDTGSSAGSSGSSGAGTTGTSGGGGTVVYEDSGTSTPTGTDCTSVSTCEGAVCKCVDGVNKDKTCQKTDKALAAYCDKLCEVCK